MDPLSEYLKSSPLVESMLQIIVGLVALLAAKHLAALQVWLGAAERERTLQTWAVRAGALFVLGLGLYNLAAWVW
jgi:hypothetical protein